MGKGMVTSELVNRSKEILLNKASQMSDAYLMQLESLAIDLIKKETESFEFIVQSITDKLSVVPSQNYLEALVNEICIWLHADYAFIGEFNNVARPEWVNPIYFSHKGESTVSHGYPLANSPCEKVLNNAIVSYRSDVKRLFPADKIVTDLNIEAYCGVLLTNNLGIPIGVLAILSCEAFPEDSNNEAILRLFAKHASAEIERLHILNELIASRETLQLRENALRQLIISASGGGHDFFNSLVIQLCNTLEADYTFIGELIPENTNRVRTISLCMNGNLIPNFEYDLLGTPCENVVGKFVCAYPSGITQLFPDDILLQQMHIEGYTGIPLSYSSGKPLGIIVALFCKPLSDVSFVESIMQIFSARAASEIERLRTENALIDSEKRYAHITETIIDYIVKVYVSNGKAVKTVHGLNCKSITGYSIEDYERDPNLWYNMVHECDKEFVFNKTKNILKGNDEKPFEHRIYHKNGEIRWLKSSPVLFRNDFNELYEYNSVISDITELKNSEAELRREKEHAEESDRLKSAFLANMSHEIRTPMNGIIGFAGLLSNERLPSEKREKYIKVIQSSTNQLLTIITDILDISKIEAGQLNILEFSFNLNTLFEEIIDQFEVEKRNRGKEHVELRVTKGLPNEQSEILADRSRINQIVSNLLANAIKFTDNGFIEIGYKLLGDDMLEFFVKDTGIGIVEEKRAIIFERFRQADDSTTRKFGGAGLGLAICKGLVDLMGGNIWVESLPAKGSTFYFSIKFKPSHNNALHVRSSGNLHKHIYKWQKHVILIVEDVDDNYMLLKEILDYTGIKTIYAPDGNSGINAISDNPEIELVLMDIQLPDINGYVASRLIKKLRPDVHIIAQTAYGLAGDREKALQAGCDEYISKPIIREKLLVLLEKYFKKEKN